MQKLISRAIEAATAAAIILAILLALFGGVGCAQHWKNHGRRVANTMDEHYLTRPAR